MHNIVRILIGITLALHITPPLADEIRKELDLSQGNAILPLEKNSYGKNLSLYVKNKLPIGIYSVEVKISSTEIDFLSQASFKTTKAPEPDERMFQGVEAATRGVDCSAFKNAVTSLKEETDEHRIPERLDSVESASAALGEDASRCAIEIGYSDTIAILDSTVGKVTSLTLEAGQTANITVTRKSPPAAGEEHVWHYTYTTAKRGEWATTWGFAFFENKSDNYYSKDVGGGSYVVTESSSKGDIDGTPEPVVMFSWFPEKKRNEDFSCGLSAGLGLDLTVPTVMLGVQATYNRNVVVSLGGAYRQYKVLKGMYSKGTTLTSAVDSTQMLEDAYLGTYYLSITYRFESSPF